MSNPNDSLVNLLNFGTYTGGSSSSSPNQTPQPSPNPRGGFAQFSSPPQNQFGSSSIDFNQLQQQQKQYETFLAFQRFQQQQQQAQFQQQFQQQHTQQQQPDSQESVPETQQQKEIRRKGKKIKGRFEGVPVQCKKTLWTPSEDAWVAQCWVDASEDSRRGNSQKSVSFWERVRNKFVTNDKGWVRNANQLTSKWRVINQNCAHFHAIYKEQVRSWGSGCDDRILLERALSEYELANHNKPFTMLKAWNVVKDKPKWLLQPLVSGGVSRQLFDEDDEPIDLDAQPEENEMFGPDAIPRPEGRPRQQKVAKSSDTSDAATSASTGGSRIEVALESIAEKKGKIVAERLESIREMRRADKLRTALASMGFLKESTEGYTAEDAETVNKLKLKIRRIAKEVASSDEDDEAGDDDSE